MEDWDQCLIDVIMVHKLDETHFLISFSYHIRIGQETLMEEDLADEEIENELSPIAVQLAYVWQVLQALRYMSCQMTQISYKVFFSNISLS